MLLPEPLVSALNEAIWVNCSSSHSFLHETQHIAVVITKNSIYMFFFIFADYGKLFRICPTRVLCQVFVAFELIKMNGPKPHFKCKNRRQRWGLHSNVKKVCLRFSGI